MKNKLLHITILFVLIMTVITIFFHLKWNSFSHEGHSRDQIVALNQIAKLIEEVNISQDQGVRSKLEASITALQEDLRSTAGGDNWEEAKRILWSMYTLCILFLILVFCYVYYMILRPFEKLKGYADEIAKGNFDAKLDFERTNFFGAFTWAFDHMRREITKARSSEKEAIDNNKTVIATLSHDIKTPIASIRAYAEGLDANLDTNAEKRRRYITVILNKCDEVTKLTNDLFLHSLTDLDKLGMKMEPVEISEVLKQTVEEMSINSEDILTMGEVQSSLVLIDKKRFVQVVENLINNSRKYAKSKIEISTKLTESDYIISVRDYGMGIKNEDMPFVFEKFYRGKNAGDEPGSGLGLYIARYICEYMKGEIILHNLTQGLEVVISLPIYQDNCLKIS